MDEKDFELAEEINRLEIARGIQKSRSGPKPPADWDQKSCIDCDEEVPKLRRSLGFFVCLECQVIREKRQRLGLSSGAS